MTTGEYQQLVEFLGRQFTEVDRRLTGLEQQVSDLRHEMLGRFDELYRRLERLEQEYHAITQGLRRIEALLGDDVTSREILERGLQELRRQVAALQARIDEIERRIQE